jgi:hypothetical protein
MSMNLDKIIHKIRELYKDRFFYKKTGPNGIIAHVNAIRQYPVAQINLALTQMVTEPNEYVNDKYGRLGRIINVGDYYLFQPIEITDKRISIHERSTPVPFKHTSIEYPLPGSITEDYLNIRPPGAMAMAMAIAPVVPNQKVVDKLKKGKAVAEEAAPENVAAPEEEEAPLGNEIDDFIATLSDTFETCKTVYEKNTKEQDEWYYYCGKVIEQISQTEEFHTTREQLYSLVISNLLEHMFFEDSLKLVNYLYQKNNYTGMGAATTGVIQPLSPFERMLLNYYEQHIIVRPLVGRRAAAASAATEGARRTPQDLGLLLFHEKKEEQYALVVLRYETREWTAAEPEDERDYELLLGKLQTSHIQNMNMIVGFVSFFKKEYLIFKVKNMS